jgi:hypothetical protein
MSYSVGNDNMVMPVAPMMGGGYGNGGCNGFGWGGDGAWWLLVLFLFAANGNGFGWGNGGAGGAMPYIMNNSTNNDVQRGFDQQAVMSALGDINGGVTSGFAGVNQSLCSGFAGVNATINNGFSAAEAANNARQMANMQQAFSLQSQLAQCCCDNRLATANLNSTILSENCADRQVFSDGVRDLLQNQTANTQALINTTNQAVQGVMDKLCQLELDAKNDKIADLQNQLSQARFDASQVAQTQRLLLDNQAQTSAIEQYLNPAPIPAYVVQNPNCCGQTYYNGCGCGR